MMNTFWVDKDAQSRRARDEHQLYQNEQIENVCDGGQPIAHHLKIDTENNIFHKPELIKVQHRPGRRDTRKCPRKQLSRLISS